MQLSRVDLLIGLDNQRWMSKHVRSSLVEGDNLRLMQSVLGPRGLLLTKRAKEGPVQCTEFVCSRA
jgi:hypothetical protein